MHVISMRLLGYATVPIPVSGTGSMYPTFPKGTGKDPKELGKEVVGYPGMLPYPNGIVFNGKRYFDYKLQRGDIVVFENEATDEITKEKYGSASGFVKRLIAFPGDTIELRGGIVYLNNKPLAEP
jgi:signal peptidase I